METLPDIVMVIVVTIIISAIPFMVLSAIRMVNDIIRELINTIKEESTAWRQAYVAKEYGSTVANNNAESSSGPAEEQSDLEQSDQSVVEPGVQAEDYAHLFSKPIETAVSFGEDVEG